MTSGVKKRKLTGVVLAAGFSSRMKGWKMEISIKGRPLLYYTLRPMLEVCENIIVVGGYSIERLSVLVGNICTAEDAGKEKIRLIKNEDFQKGMFSSVKSGLEVVDKSSEAVFIMPGDIPFVSLSTYTMLINLLEEKTDKDVIFPTTLINLEGGGVRWKKGHPVLLRNSVREAVINNPNEAVFREVLKPLSFELCPVSDGGICFDIDDETDLHHALSYIESSYKYP
ncbi:MAG TPA: NTP transferase domain-containing protein [Ignavibacteriales bacterium]|nr:NTP transferase domain-containing protein [Ignavibacteriales bacterium]